jgi:hypothetical protein
MSVAAENEAPSRRSDPLHILRRDSSERCSEEGVLENRVRNLTKRALDREYYYTETRVPRRLLTCRLPGIKRTPTTSSQNSVNPDSGEYIS